MEEELSALQDDKLRISTWRGLIDAYALADMLLDSHSKNAILTYLIEVNRSTKKYPGWKATHIAYESTTATSPLRRLLVDFVVKAADHKLDYYEQKLDTFPHQFVVDLSLQLMRLRKEEKSAVHPKNAPKCTYHEHDEANTKCE